MNQAGIQKLYLPNTLSAHRVEFDCNFCGGKLSLDAPASDEKTPCPFCRETADGSTARFFKQEVSIAIPDSRPANNAPWQHRYTKQKRWWMRRRFCEKKLESLLNFLFAGNGRVFALLAGMAVAGGVLAFVLGVG